MNLKGYDKSFDVDKFTSQANNMIKKILNAISLDELYKVEHFMSEEFYKSLEEKLSLEKKEIGRFIFDEVNVSCLVLSDYEDEDNYYLEVEANLKYLKYLLGSDNVGANDNRIEEKKFCVFKKNKSAKSLKIHRCYNCGQIIDVNENGFCPYCRKAYDLFENDYVLDKIK